MRKVEVHELLSALNNLSRNASIAKHDPDWAYADDERIKSLDYMLEKITTQLNILELRLSANKASSIKCYFQMKGSYSTKVMASVVSSSLEELSERIEEELEDRALYYVVQPHAKLIDDGASAFGSDVIQKFPDSVADLSEAARCLGLSCNTACVFHLMRSMERALRAIGNHFSATIVDKNDKPLSWGVILSNVNKRIQAMPVGIEREN